jgi:hypothetical protein
MEAHLYPLIQRRSEEGVSIKFLETLEGDRKKSVVRKVPVRAARIIANDPTAMVVALPDLYPPVDGCSTLDALRQTMHRTFLGALKGLKQGDDQRFLQRFQVFCFKHDLEALVLAAEEALAQKLGLPTIKPTWTVPVEDQDHDSPPKRVVEQLFRQHGQSYQETVDAPLILASTDLAITRERCPQCFDPFVRFLEGVQPSFLAEAHAPSKGSQ